MVRIFQANEMILRAGGEGRADITGWFEAATLSKCHGRHDDRDHTGAYRDYSPEMRAHSCSASPQRARPDPVMGHLLIVAGGGAL
jgi:hypothetical protein